MVKHDRIYGGMIVMQLKMRVALLVFTLLIAMCMPVFAAWNIYGDSGLHIYQSNGQYYIYFNGYTGADTDPDYISVMVDIYDPDGYYFDQIYETDTDNYVWGETQSYLWFSGEKYTGLGTHIAKIYHWYGDDVKRVYSSF